MSHSPEVIDKMNEIKQRFRARLSNTYDTVEQLKSAPDCDKLIDICHQLAGTAGTFGYVVLSDEMKQIEQDLLSLKAEGLDNKTLNLQCDAVMATLKKAITV